MTNLAVYAYTSVAGGNFLETNQSILLRWGQLNLYVIEGWYWQLFTSIFVHVNFVHLFLNMLFLLIFGFRAEELFSVEEYLTIYFISGFSGNFLTLLLMDPLTLSAGASGAIFGVFGASVVYMRRTLGQSVIGALLYSFLFFLMSAGVGVNIVAHFGGLAVGIIIGYALAKNRKIIS